MDDDTFSEVVQTCLILDVVCVSSLLSGSGGTVLTLGGVHVQLAVEGDLCTHVVVGEFETWMDSGTEFEDWIDSETKSEA